MKIDVFAVSWNEQMLMPYFIRHYQKFARSITIFDNHSTDESPDIARKMGVVVKPFGHSKLDDREYLKIKNNCYKRSDADYVVVCDLDEFLYHPDLVNTLTKLKQQGIQLPNVHGYNMYSELLPNGGQIYDTIKTGYSFGNYGKQIVFSPKIDIRFELGCHANKAKGTRGGEVYLLHYRCIGGVNEMINRHRIYSQRLCDFNLRYKLGGHYLRSEAAIKKDWQECVSKSKVLEIL